MHTLLVDYVCTILLGHKCDYRNLHKPPYSSQKRHLDADELSKALYRHSSTSGHTPIQRESVIILTAWNGRRRNIWCGDRTILRPWSTVKDTKFFGCLIFPPLSQHGANGILQFLTSGAVKLSCSSVLLDNRSQRVPDRKFIDFRAWQNNVDRVVNLWT